MSNPAQTRLSDKSSTDPSRRAALNVLSAVLSNGSGLEDALSQGRSRLKDARDRAFLHHVVMAVLRHLGEINMVLDTFMKRQPTGRARLVVRALQLGVAQLLYMDVPAYAAASTTVDLVRKLCDA